jgi:hypothetical protein
VQPDRRCYCAVQQDLIARVEVLGHTYSLLGELQNVSHVPPANKYVFCSPEPFGFAGWLSL